MDLGQKGTKVLFIGEETASFKECKRCDALALMEGDWGLIARLKLNGLTRHKSQWEFASQFGVAEERRPREKKVGARRGRTERGPKQSRPSGPERMVEERWWWSNGKQEGGKGKKKTPKRAPTS